MIEKIDKLAVIEIKKEAAKLVRVNTEIRYGQAIFNAAYAMFPCATNQLRNTQYDCYYHDDRVNDFLTKLINCQYEKRTIFQTQTCMCNTIQSATFSNQRELSQPIYK